MDPIRSVLVVSCAAPPLKSEAAEQADWSSMLEFGSGGFWFPGDGRFQDHKGEQMSARLRALISLPNASFFPPLFQKNEDSLALCPL